MTVIKCIIILFIGLFRNIW